MHSANEATHSNHSRYTPKHLDHVAPQPKGNEEVLVERPEGDLRLPWPKACVDDLATEAGDAIFRSLSVIPSKSWSLSSSSNCLGRLRPSRRGHSNQSKKRLAFAYLAGIFRQ